MEKENKSKKEEKAKEKHKNKYTLPIIFGVVLAIVIIVIFAFSNSQISNTSNNNQNQETKKSCKDVQVPYDYLEEYQETVPYTDRECETKELAYSITNFVMGYNTCNKQEYICKDTFLGICTEKTYYCVDRSVSCSINLKNLDTEERGTWQITFNYLDQNTRNTIKSEIRSEFLYPQTEETLTSAVRVTSTGVEGDANKDTTCTYQATNVPTKQVCRDVTKYKEVTKTRTVTRYRTEEKCE